MGRLYTTKLSPYRILVILTYHDYTWCTWTGLHCKLRIGCLSKLLQSSNSRTHGYFDYLAKHGYIKNFEHLIYGYVEFDLAVPDRVRLHYIGGTEGV